MMDKKMGGGMCVLHKAGMALLILGGIHLGLWSAFGIDLPTMLFGPGHIIPWIVNILIGISAIATLFMGKCCMKGGTRGCGCGCGMCGTCSVGDKACGCADCKMCVPHESHGGAEKGGSCSGSAGSCSGSSAN